MLLLKVLGHRALDRLAGLELERKGLRVRRPSGHVAHAVLASHGSAVGDLDLEALDLLGELDALGVVERLVVLVYVGQVEYLAEELDHGLALVEGGGRHVDVQAHLPLRRSHRLMKAEPDLASATQRIVEVHLRRREERAADGRVAHAGQVAHDDVERLYAVVGHAHALALESVLERVQAHLGLEANAHLELAVLALAGQRHVHVELLVADVGQVLLGVEVLLAVEDRPLVAEQSRLGLHERVEYVTVDALRTLVRLDAHRVVVDEALGYLDGEVIGAQLDRLALRANARPGWRRERKGQCRRRCRRAQLRLQLSLRLLLLLLLLLLSGRSCCGCGGSDGCSCSCRSGGLLLLLLLLLLQLLLLLLHLLLLLELLLELLLLVLVLLLLLLLLDELMLLLLLDEELLLDLELELELKLLVGAEYERLRELRGER